jgi:signal peptidase I
LAPFGQAVSEEKVLLTVANQKKELLLVAMFVGQMEPYILFSDWLLLKKSSPLKLLGKMEPNLARSIYVRSSIKFLRFIPFGQQIWLPRAILVSDWLMLNKSSQAVSEEKVLLTVANQKQELLLVAMFVGQMEPYEEAL